MAADKLILFDLDDTLSDAKAPIRAGLLAIQAADPTFGDFDIENLAEEYKQANIITWNRLVDGDEKVRRSFEKAQMKQFYKSLNLDPPGREARQAFKDVYKPAFRTGYAATPGSIDVLRRLRELGYRIAIVTDGRARFSRMKVDDIGAAEYIERIFTPEDVDNHRKPDKEIFELAVNEMGCTKENTWVVGDCHSRDVKGAIDAGLEPVIYLPERTDREKGNFWYGRTVPIINHLSQLLEILGESEAAEAT